MRRKSYALWAALSLGLALTACGYEEPTLSVPQPDMQSFALDVYPLLLRDCGFPACHGNPARFFRIYGPGRTRLPSQTEVLDYDPATPAEIAATYDRARSMLSGPDDVEHSPLLRKPLAKKAGGAGHEGEDPWGRNVYASASDPAYVKLREWALSTAQSAQGGAP